MSKKVKFKLENLTVQSFVTSLAAHQMHKINGAGLTDGNCEIVRYTRNSNCCIDPTDYSACDCRGGGGGGGCGGGSIFIDTTD